eukprot:jgi/Chrzof1/3699/Cz13g05180.t1
MGRGRSSTWKLLRSCSNPAVTRFFSTSLSEVKSGMRLYIIRPETGKTHQIRVALKSLGAPVLGDPIYSAADDSRHQDRAYLHALGIRIPIGGQLFQVICRPCIKDTLFAHPAFQDTLDAWFPESLQQDTAQLLPTQPYQSPHICEPVI